MTVGTGGAAGNNSAAPPTASALVVSCAASSARCVDASERARTGAVERPPELLRHASSPSLRPRRASPAVREVAAGRRNALRLCAVQPPRRQAAGGAAARAARPGPARGRVRAVALAPQPACVGTHDRAARGAIGGGGDVIVVAHRGEHCSASRCTLARTPCATTQQSTTLPRRSCTPTPSTLPANRHRRVSAWPLCIGSAWRHHARGMWAPTLDQARRTQVHLCRLVVRFVLAVPTADPTELTGEFVKL